MSHGTAIAKTTSGTAAAAAATMPAPSSRGIEPTEGLDGAVLAELPTVIGEVTSAGGTVLVSDHSGKLVDLPGAQRWVVAGGRVAAERLPADDTRCVIEVAVASARAADTVAQLRAAGHEILGVREEPTLDHAHWTAS